MGQWTPLNTGLQTHRSMTFFGSDLYVAAFPSGVHKSVNDGLTWTPVNTGFPVDGSGNIFVRSVGRSATFLFAGTHSGIYRSNNDGASWTLANGSLPASSTIYANKFFTFGNITFAVFTGLISQGGGIYRTTNNGTSWEVGHSGLSTNMRVYHLTYDNNFMYAGTNIGIYRSGDLGLSWQPWSDQVQFDIYGIQRVGNRTHVISAGGYRFRDDGAPGWTTATGAPTNPTRGELISYNGNLYAITGSNSGCIISTNNGVSYTAFNTGISPVDQLGGEQFLATPTRLYLGALLDMYYIAGSTVDVDEEPADALPRPYPTAFMDGFNLVLPEGAAQRSVVLIDALGREAARHGGLPSGAVFVPRGALNAGRYLVVLEDASGTRRRLGQVIAQ
jgi:photosystem II stability/assembly factor-like uncharacterized protein